MTETTATNKTQTVKRAASSSTPDYGMPKFEMPKFGLPNTEMPEAFRAGPGCLNSFSASISGVSAGVRLPSGGAAA